MLIWASGLMLTPVTSGYNTTTKDCDCGPLANEVEEGAQLSDGVFFQTCAVFGDPVFLFGLHHFLSSPYDGLLQCFLESNIHQNKPKHQYVWEKWTNKKSDVSSIHFRRHINIRISNKSQVSKQIHSSWSPSSTTPIPGIAGGEPSVAGQGYPFHWLRRWAFRKVKISIFNWEVLFHLVFWC